MQKKTNNAFELRWDSKYVFRCISFKSTKLVKSKNCIKKTPTQSQMYVISKLKKYKCQGSNKKATEGSGVKSEI